MILSFTHFEDKSILKTQATSIRKLEEVQNNFKLITATYMRLQIFNKS